jgi:A/G-specific adenine glycosylase
MGLLDREPRKIAALRRRLLDWYTRNRRDLPWRKSRDPYAIWVSEIMLQQTRVAVVVERYKAFLERFPSLVALALALEEDVLALWSGLGYYRRARMLHKAAQFVAGNHHANLPATAEELRALPGIGSYTAAAIASIAHGEPVAVVDGNVERVLCRLEGWDAKDGGAALKRKIKALATHLVDPARPGDFNQAMMELGAVVCTPRNPQCKDCPLFRDCQRRGEHKTAARAPMLSREIGHALCVRGRMVLLERRPDELTVMPGMWELPALREAVFPEEHLHMAVRHAIMQVNYSVRIRTVAEDEIEELTMAGGERRWVATDEAKEMALTGLARKVLVRAHLLSTASSPSLLRRRRPT